MVPAIIKPSLRGEEYRLIKTALPVGRVAVVTDSNTYEALGKRILQSLPKGSYLHLHDDLEPEATTATAAVLAKESQNCAGIVAIGSGTINDLSKYAAHLLKIPYLVFPTAPSMNGYVSTTASLAETEMKTSHQATPPVLVACDLEILSQAPVRLLRAGLGDSLARFTAQIDWLLSHLLLDTDYDDRPYQMLVPHEQYVFKHADQLTTGNLPYIEQLMRLLLAAGEGMSLMKSSAPFSQGEHMLAHTLEMFFPDKIKQFYHGEQIAVTATTVAGHQGRFLIGDAAPAWNANIPDVIKPTDSYWQKRELIGDPLIFQQKIRAHWPTIRKKLIPYFITTDKIQEICEAAGMDSNPESLKIDASAYQRVVQVTPLTRERFGFLDLIPVN